MVGEDQAEWAERSELERLARGRKAWRAPSDRTHIVLPTAEGLTNVQIADTLGINNLTARKWRKRFAEYRMDVLQDEPRPGRPRRIDDDAVAEAGRKTLEDKPRDATHWNTRSMAHETGYAPSTIHRIWRTFSLQPQWSETFRPTLSAARSARRRYRSCPAMALPNGRGSAPSSLASRRRRSCRKRLSAASWRR